MPSATQLTGAVCSQLDVGATKSCMVSVRVPTGPGGDATALVQRVLKVRVRAGTAAGTELRFRRHGHQDPGRPAGEHS